MQNTENQNKTIKQNSENQDKTIKQNSENQNNTSRKISENQDRTSKLATAPLLKLMFSLGIPTFIAQLINLLYNIVDRVYIGHIPGDGAMALTGLGLCFPIIMFVSAFAYLAGAGGAPLAGIALGEGNKEKAEKILGNSIIMLFAFSILLTVIFQIIKKPFLYTFGASDTTYLYASKYLTVYLMGTIFVLFALGLNLYITIQGEALVAMTTILIGAILNIILDPIFIFLLHMGVTGAALATIISQAISALWILRFLLSDKASLKSKKDALKIEWPIIGQIASLGISPCIMNSTESLIVVIFNRGAQIYGGDLYVASITILQSVMQIIFVPMSGFSQGVQSIISYNYGAKNYQRVRKASKTLILITFLSSFILTGICMLIPRTISSAFTTETALLDLCQKVMPIYLAGMLVFGLQSGSQSSFMALGKAKQSLFFALLRKVFLLTPLALFLPTCIKSLFGLAPVMGIYIAEPISDVLSATCCVSTFLWTLKRIDKE